MYLPFLSTFYPLPLHVYLFTKVCLVDCHIWLFVIHVSRIYLYRCSYFRPVSVLTSSYRYSSHPHLCLVFVVSFITVFSFSLFFTVMEFVFHHIHEFKFPCHSFLHLYFLTFSFSTRLSFVSSASCIFFFLAVTLFFTIYKNWHFFTMFFFIYRLL